MLFYHSVAVAVAAALRIDLTFQLLDVESRCFEVYSCCRRLELFFQDLDFKISKVSTCPTSLVLLSIPVAGRLELQIFNPTLNSGMCSRRESDCVLSDGL